MSRTAHAGFILDALEQAVRAKKPAKGIEPRASQRPRRQYLSIKYSGRLAQAGIDPSIGSVGDSYDNALAETINGLYKDDVIHRHAARGDRSRRSNTPPSIGSTSSIIATCSAPSATSRPLKPKNITMPPEKTSIWLHDSNQTAYGKPGAVQSVTTMLRLGWQSPAAASRVICRLPSTPRLMTRPEVRHLLLRNFIISFVLLHYTIDSDIRFRYIVQQNTTISQVSRQCLP